MGNDNDNGKGQGKGTDFNAVFGQSVGIAGALTSLCIILIGEAEWYHALALVAFSALALYSHIYGGKA